jgi:hypothetical protein
MSTLKLMLALGNNMLSGYEHVVQVLLLLLLLLL